VLQSQRDSLLQQLEQQKKDRNSYVDVLEEKNALEDSLRYNVAVYGCLNIANWFEEHSPLHGSFVRLILSSARVRQNPQNSILMT